LDTGNITENRIGEIQRIVMGRDALPSRARRKVAPGDILYSTVRPNQRHYGIIRETTPNMLVSTGFAVITPDRAVADSDFIYYYLTQGDIVESLHAIGEQSVSAYPSIRPSDIENIELLMPPLGRQAEIGRTLRALDDRIENNARINRHLEEAARAVFREWFVDFGPWGGVMPDSWQDAVLGDIVEIRTKTLDPNSCPNIDLEHYSIPAFDETHLPVFERASKIKSNKYIIDKNCFLISKLNPATKRIWRPHCISNFAVCSTEFIVFQAKTHIHRDFCYSIVDSLAFTEYLLSHITGSTGSRQRAVPSETLLFSLFVPPDNVIEDYCDIVAPIYTLFEHNQIENHLIRQTRDALLPCLMSGELRVADPAAK
jgi:type I restriction enzyme S subunit